MKNRIRELRKQNKMTLKELGNKLGLAESTISQYETGKREPDNETLLKLGEIFGVSVGYILLAEPIMPLQTPSERDLPDKIKAALQQEDGKTSEIMEILLELPAEKQQEALNYLRYLSENASK